MSGYSATIEIEPEDAGKRLDQFLASHAWSPSRSQIKTAIQRGEVLVNGETVKAGHALKVGDLLDIDWMPPPLPNLVPEAIPLHILHEDDHVIVLVKSSGMVVHPGAGHPSGTLANAVFHHVGPEIEEVGPALRPGIVHRLDKDTSGVMIVAKTLDALTHLGRQFAAHSTDRKYLALCHGPGLPERGTFDTLHGRHPKDRKRFSSRVTRGRHAVTHYEVLERFRDGAVLVQCQLETGRTHQVRVHLSEHHAPILADPMYGGRGASKSRLIDRVALHAVHLAFDHPADETRMGFDAPLPDDFAHALDALRAGKAWR